MKKVIREYLALKNEERERLWDEATFIFDTNVLLNLYRYSPNTSNQLLNAIEQLKDHVWMPYQVAYEFSKNRIEVIYESADERFSKIKKQADALLELSKNSLRIDMQDEDLLQLNEYLNNWIEEKKKKSCLVSNPNEDYILDKLLDLFDNKVGQPFSKEECNTIRKEGDTRYSNSIPPGFKDKNKANNEYGDLFVWKEILKFAKENKKSIIYVTHDQKKDWWYIYNGRTIGPRAELRKEFYDETNQGFHMYSMSSFLTTFSEKTGKEIGTSTYEEINLLLEQKESEEELEQYSDNNEDEKEKRALEIRYEIVRLETKNQKRERVIANLYTQDRKKPLNNKRRQYLENNEANFQKDKRRIESLQKELASL